MEDLLCKEEIVKYLNNPESFNISVFENLDSTNAYLKQLAKSGENSGTVIIADSQTFGHGRFDRKFHSPENSGIYMSVLLKPALPAEQSVMLTAAAAVAVCEAIEALTVRKPKIKWVNDILLNGKKACGILTEGAVNPQTLEFDWAVIGIGINVYTPKDDFSPEIKDIATALLDQKKENFRNRLCAEILNRLNYYCKNLNKNEFIRSYKEYSAFLGEKITVIKNGIFTPAKAMFIDDNCRLAVSYDDGREELLSSGEISIKL